jgi:CRP-like cAMP-binding protein
MVVRGRRSRRPAAPEESPRHVKRRSAVALAGVPLFDGISKRHLRALAEASDEVSFRPGEQVVREGDPGETLYVVVEGEGKVTRGGRRVGRVLPGDFFGELSALDAGPRTATVTAATPLVAVRVFRRGLFDLLSREAGFAQALLRGIARRLRDVERSLSS